MQIDISTIEGYAEMTAEQKVEALEKFEFQQEDNSAEIEKLKNAVSKANSEAAEWKRKHNALLSEDEQKKAEAEEANKKMLEELESLKKDKTVSEYTAKYLAQGYSAELAKESAEALANNDFAKVFEIQEKHNKSLEEKIKKDLMNGTKKPDGSGGDDGSDDKDDPAIEKAKAIGKAKIGDGKSYDDVLKNYR